MANVLITGTSSGIGLAATLLPDACTIEHSPLRFPPVAQALVDGSEALSDERFLSLASLDLSPALYESAAPPWAANRPADNEQ